ncbi:MAG: hypothetical protein DRQ78_09265 [Epsilonproteobacteria bacterium]|nr:MAG: hypothetical protein DRQ78_09265 [Campylobacterota bacterium]
MKYLGIWLVLLGFLHGNTEDFKDPFEDIIYIKLDNGMQVYMLSNKKAVNTQIEVTVNVGTDIENDENYGISHLLEHMIFRDQRVPHRDYLDYMKEEGASYVNGYTSRYKSGYRTTIDANKSYWVAEIFSRMLFDKNVTDYDLKSEKGAVQTEIGKEEWPDPFLYGLKIFFNALDVPMDNIYENDFSLKKIKEIPSWYRSKQNNQKFTLEEVMQHYDKYYYPSNMTMKIAGHFDVQKMKNIIIKHYGGINKKGNAKTILPLENPNLNHKPFIRFYEGLDKNMGYIGVKYIMDNYKKYLILKAYTTSLALRLQRKLRNDLGHTYSINAVNFNQRKAGIASVYFDGLHEEFESNIQAVRKNIEKDKKHLSHKVIAEALKEYRKTYTAIEYDSGSLMELIENKKYLQEKYDSKQSAYEIFNTITDEEFRITVQEAFVDENTYSIIYRDYYFFPHDISIFSFFMFVILVFLYFKLYHIDRIQKNILCTQRNTIISRRISNRFLGFIYIIGIFIVSAYVWGWVKYLFFTYILGDSFYVYAIDIPYSYLWTFFDYVMSIVVFLLLCKYIFPYFSRIEISKEHMCVIGHSIIVLDKENIESLSVVKWNIKKSIKGYGLSLLFWKPLVCVTMKDGKKYYMRSRNAQHLKEDLEQYL